MRAAVPVDRPVGADERGRVEVADDPVLGDREVAGERGARASEATPSASVPHSDAVLSRRASTLQHPVQHQRVGEQEAWTSEPGTTRQLHGRSRRRSRRSPARPAAPRSRRRSCPSTARGGPRRRSRRDLAVDDACRAADSTSPWRMIHSPSPKDASSPAAAIASSSAAGRSANSASRPRSSRSSTGTVFMCAL